MLPERSPEAEDRFLAELAAEDDVDAMTDAVEAALDARRPLLAARVVGLLDGRVEIEPGSPVARAQAAARMLLVRGGSATVAELAEFEDLCRTAVKRRLARVRARHAGAAEGRLTRVSRVTGRTRRR